MKIFSILTVWCLGATLTLQAQGVRFQTDGDWLQVLAKAKAAHKMVFINCYMEGGAPCIEMDKKVYPVKAAGDFYNKNFICIAVNMERVVTDEKSKALKLSADSLKRRFGVNGYPNLLYIDSKGVLVHRYIGSDSPAGFIRTGKDALNPSKQFYTQLADFRTGKRDNALLRDLAKKAYYFGESKAADSIVNAYLSNKTENQQANRADITLISGILHDAERAKKLTRIYIDGLTEAQKLIPENLKLVLSVTEDPKVIVKYIDQFLASNPDSVLLKSTGINIIIQVASNEGSAGKSFQYIYQHLDAIDNALGMKNSMSKLIDRIITTEIVNPLMVPASKTTQQEMDWKAVKDSISVKFRAEDAERNLLGAQERWYGFRQNWKAYTRVLVAADKKFGADRAAYEINNSLAAPLLAHSNDQEELNYALSRMKTIVVNAAPSTIQINNYANLLYKTGQKEEAIKWEKIALASSPDDQKVKDNLEKMTNGSLKWN